MRQAPAPHTEWAELEAARCVLIEYQRALSATASNLDGEFLKLRTLPHAAGGQVIVCGIGKSGQVARAISRSFRENGKCSPIVHAAEAAHGALGTALTLGQALSVR